MYVYNTAFDPNNLNRDRHYLVTALSRAKAELHIVN